MWIACGVIEDAGLEADCQRLVTPLRRYGRVGPHEVREAPHVILLTLPDTSPRRIVAVGILGVAAEDSGHPEGPRQVADANLKDTPLRLLELSQLPHPPAGEHVNVLLEPAAIEFERPRVVIVGWIERQAAGLLAELPAEAVAHRERIGLSFRLDLDLLQQWHEAALRVARREIGIDVVDGQRRLHACQRFVELATGLPAKDRGHASPRHQIALVGAVDEHLRGHPPRRRRPRLRRRAAQPVGRGMIERDALDDGAVAFHRRHPMLEDHRNAVLGEQVAKKVAVLGVVEAPLENATGRATDRLAASPVDMAQATAGHAAKPPRWLDHDDPRSLPRRGHRRHDAAGCGTVDTHVHRVALVAPGTGGRRAIQGKTSG